MYGDTSDGLARSSLKTNLVQSTKAASKHHLNGRAGPDGCVSTSATLRCSEAGCQYHENFRSKHELRRHISNKHNKAHATRSFKCNALGCLKDGQRTVFARADKLTAHIRALHKKSASFECPRNGCEQGPLDGLQMFVHVQSHLESQDLESGASLKAVANALSPAFSRCPMERCRKSVALPNVIDHLLDHGNDAIRSNSMVLISSNFLYAPSVEEEEETLDSSWVAPFMRIFVSCPLCKLHWPSPAEFRNHLIEVHMHANPHHFRIWVTHVEDTLVAHGYVPLHASTGGSIRELLCNATIWTAWRFVLMNSHTVDVKFRCPECNIIESVTGSMTSVHHLSMLDRFEELYPYRREVLALCPQFASHPVFKDLHVPEQIKEPYAFRLQQVGNSRTAKASSAQTNSEQSKVVSVWRPIDDLARKLQPGAHFEHATNETRTGDFCDVLNGVGVQFHDPMVGGREETAVAANDLIEAHMHAPSPDVMPYTNISRIVEVTQAFEPSVTKLQPYSHGKLHSCERLGCNLRFERPSELHLHQRAHVDARVRPHKCIICGKGFTYPKDRRRHEKIHDSQPKQPPRITTDLK